MTQYKPEVLQGYADGLYIKSALIVAGWLSIGLVATVLAVNFIEMPLRSEDAKTLDAVKKVAIQQATIEHDASVARCRTFIGDPAALARTEECIEAAQTRIQYRIPDYPRQSRLLEWISGAGILLLALFVGLSRSFKYRLEAQKILCQVEIERHLRQLWAIPSQTGSQLAAALSQRGQSAGT